MPMTPKEMIKFLRSYGCIEVRQNTTSHKIMYSPVTKKSFPVPMHNKGLGKGLEREILKQAGIKKK